MCTSRALERVVKNAGSDTQKDATPMHAFPGRPSPSVVSSVIEAEEVVLGWGPSTSCSRWESHRSSQCPSSQLGRCLEG